MRNSPALGAAHTIDTEHGPIVIRETGDGPPIVFVHGLLVNGDLWRKVVPHLSERFRCITPDLPLGSHERPMKADADLTPPSLARLIGSLLEKLDLDDVTLVANDTGGALCQLLVTETPERVGRLVLTSCDAYDIFPPKMFAPLSLAARIPGALGALASLLGARPLRGLPFAFGWLTKKPLDHDVIDEYLRPLSENADVRRDLVKILSTVDPAYTQAAAKKLPSFTKPVLLAWSREDRFFPMSYAERLARDFPNARLEPIDDSYSFSPEDQPEAVARAISGFARPRAAAAS